MRITAATPTDGQLVHGATRPALTSDSRSVILDLIFTIALQLLHAQEPERFHKWHFAACGFFGPRAVRFTSEGTRAECAAGSRTESRTSTSSESWYAHPLYVQRAHES